MKKILMFLMFLFLPIGVNAYYCNYDDYNEAQKKALNVNYFVDYEIIDDKAIFTITLYNIRNYQSIIDVNNQKTYSYGGKDYIRINVTEPGIYKYEIYSNENYCDDNYLNKIFVEIPTYNKYYKDELCKGIENYKYCQKWFSTKVEYDEFKKAVYEYKEKIKAEEPNQKEEYKSIYEYLLEFYLNYWFILLPIIIVVGITGIIIIKKRENKFKL